MASSVSQKRKARSLHTHTLTHTQTCIFMLPSEKGILCGRCHGFQQRYSPASSWPAAYCCFCLGEPSQGVDSKIKHTHTIHNFHSGTMKAVIIMFKGDPECLNGVFIFAFWCQHSSNGALVSSEMHRILFYSPLTILFWDVRILQSLFLWIWGPLMLVWQPHVARLYMLDYHSHEWSRDFTFLCGV